MPKIKKLLIANRGEIALRVMRTAREMGICTVAVYSDADRGAPHVLFADEAYHLGPAPSSQSYLKGNLIISICLQHGIDAIHPGYGFLSENAAFARAVEQAGLILVGPSAASMDLMGNKLSAKKAVSDFKIPMVPGTPGAITDSAEAARIAQEIGFPVLLKAAAGGGGKGMRIVNAFEEFEGQLQLAQNEARSAFGDDAVFIEKYIGSPRHIEIQIMGDQHGNTVYLFERECSIQRRHQKLVEEAPSSCLTPEIRKAMGEAAVRVAKACNYYGAGTVEFLADEDLNYYFLEMNTRLQVEHPVTELITGLDLVRLQILVAEGEKLPFTQEDLHIQGHAIELRICAEDPRNNFLPDIGKLERYIRPQGTGVRVDDGYEQGMDIPIHYDPMIAKLVVHAETRELAMDRMLRAISEYDIRGFATTLPFGAFVMKHEAFRSGHFDTKFIERYYKPEMLDHEDMELEEVAALAAALLFEQGDKKTQPNTTQVSTQPAGGMNAWRMRRGF
ncbi:MAG: acetyl/propionyl/methylcrotonyl-CoA carboxylase subunit alpha [Bacteroidia bacterium]